MPCLALRRACARAALQGGAVRRWKMEVPPLGPGVIGWFEIFGIIFCPPPAVPARLLRIGTLSPVPFSLHHGGSRRSKYRPLRDDIRRSRVAMRQPASTPPTHPACLSAL